MTSGFQGWGIGLEHIFQCEKSNMEASPEVSMKPQDWMSLFFLAMEVTDGYIWRPRNHTRGGEVKPQHTPTSGRNLRTADHWPCLRGSNSIIRRWHRVHIFKKSLCVITWNTSGPQHLWTVTCVHCFPTHEMLLYTSYLISLFSFLSDVMLREWPQELCGRLNRKIYTNDRLINWLMSVNAQGKNPKGIFLRNNWYCLQMFKQLCCQPQVHKQQQRLLIYSESLALAQAVPLALITTNPFILLPV